MKNIISILFWVFCLPLLAVGQPMHRKSTALSVGVGQDFFTTNWTYRPAGGIPYDEIDPEHSTSGFTLRLGLEQRSVLGKPTVIMDYYSDDHGSYADVDLGADVWFGPNGQTTTDWFSADGDEVISSGGYHAGIGGFFRLLWVFPSFAKPYKNTAAFMSFGPRLDYVNHNGKSVTEKALPSFRYNDAWNETLVSLDFGLGMSFEFGDYSVIPEFRVSLPGLAASTSWDPEGTVVRDGGPFMMSYNLKFAKVLSWGGDK